MERLVNISRYYLDNNVKRSSGYIFYINPLKLSPVTFANIIHRICMILYLSIDTENKDSIYNKYYENFLSNLSVKLIEELYIKCLRGKDKDIEDYVEYLTLVINRLIELKSDALMEIFQEFGSNCSLLKKINDALMNAPNEAMSPVKSLKQAFKDFDNIDLVKYYIYKTDIQNAEIPKIEVEDIKLMFDYLNISILYKLQHHGENCIKKKCAPELKIITEDLNTPDSGDFATFPESPEISTSNKPSKSARSARSARSEKSDKSDKSSKSATKSASKSISDLLSSLVKGTK